MRDRFTPRQRFAATATFEGSAERLEVELHLGGLLLRAGARPDLAPAARVRGQLSIGPERWPFEAEVAWRQEGSAWLATGPVHSLRFTRIDPGYLALLGQGATAA